MKLKYEFAIENVMSAWVAVAVGKSAARYSNVVNLNETSRVLFARLATEATIADLVDTLAAEFEAPADVLDADVRAFVQQLNEQGLLEGEIC